MNTENVVYVHNGVLFSYNKKQNYVVCRKMDGIEDYHVKQSEPDTERQILHVFFHMWTLDLKERFEHRWKTIWEEEGNEEVG
jgi:hypothetical protein